MIDYVFSFGVLIGAVVCGFLLGVVVGWNLRGDDYQPIANPTDPRTRPSDYPVGNPGFGPDYPFNERPFRRTK